MEVFLNPRSKPVSCHLLIDEQGKLYELVDCWRGACQKAFHAGSSFLLDSQGKKWIGFNSFSLGIELVNWNGNIFNFTASQYKSLFKALFHLKSLYPSLSSPERIVGHEHIAGFRGKKDPGYFFDWLRLFQNVYPRRFSESARSPADQSLLLARKPALTKKQQGSLAFLKDSPKWNDKKAKKISLLMENERWPFWLKKLAFWLLMR